MSERERLVELIGKLEYFCHETFAERFPRMYLERIADRLLENGVIAPNLKLGDKVWIIERYYGYKIKSYEVVYIKYVKDSSGQLCYYSAMPFGKPILSIDFNDRDIGKIVFLSKEQAEAALQGGAERWQN